MLWHILHSLDDAAGAQAGSPQIDEILRILQIGDTAGSLDLHVGPHVLGEQGHVLPGGAAPAEAGGGLDLVRAGGCGDLTHLDFFFLCQKAGLDYHFENVFSTSSLDLFDFIKHIVILFGT